MAFTKFDPTQINGAIPSSYIVGTTTNNSATVGYVGEYIDSVIAMGSPVSSTGTTQFFTVTSIALTAGDWDVSLICNGVKAGSTPTVFFAGIGTVNGNDATGLISGSNAGYGFLPTATPGTIAVPPYRISIASPTTYYFKAYFEYTGTAPTAYGRISARRVR